MYDFYFGELNEILENEESYLLFLKRMLPRWTNSIPDSEYLDIFEILNKIDTRSKKPVLVETGVGASSLVMSYFAIKNKGVLYSWDINGSKSAFLRGVVNDTICKSFNKPLHEHWIFIAYSSTDKYLGIPILKEKGEKVDFCFLDSVHTLDNISAEIGALIPVFNDTAYISIDDANYTARHTNLSIINLFRKKLGLKPVEDPPDNRCREYYLEITDFLKKNFKSVELLDNPHKKSYTKDIYFSYYKSDKKVMDDVGMEKLNNLEHRFAAWKVKN